MIDFQKNFYHEKILEARCVRHDPGGNFSRNIETNISRLKKNNNYMSTQQSWKIAHSIELSNTWNNMGVRNRSKLKIIFKHTWQQRSLSRVPRDKTLVPETSPRRKWSAMTSPSCWAPHVCQTKQQAANWCNPSLGPGCDDVSGFECVNSQSREQPRKRCHPRKSART